MSGMKRREFIALVGAGGLLLRPRRRGDRVKAAGYNVGVRVREKGYGTAQVHAGGSRIDTGPVIQSPPAARSF
jgi:hypothetical protein